MNKAALAARRFLLAVGVVASLVVTLVAASANANPPSASISIVGTGTLVSNPGPVNVTLHYTCLPPSPGFIVLSLNEDGLAVGGAAEDAVCDGRNHSLTVTVDGLFYPGTAGARADITNTSGGSTAETTATVNIK